MSRTTGAVAAVASSLWGTALSIFAVRIYVARLGVEAYGVIGFFLSLQVVLQVLDLGLAPSVNRELARASAVGREQYSRTLLTTLARVYWWVAVLIAVALAAAAPLLASYWLGASRMPPTVIEQSLAIMGLVIAARWPVALYQSALIGLGRLAIASGVTASVNTVAVVASIAVLTFVSPTLPAFFATQALVAIAYALIMRMMAWRALGHDATVRPDWKVLRHLWRFSAGMGGVALTGIALTQLDKAILSNLLPLAQFGEYMLAVTAMNGLAALVSPVFSVIFPRLSALVAARQDEAVRLFYLSGTQLFAGLYLPVAIALGLYAHDVVWIWTGNVGTADRVAPLLTLLCIGSAINGLMYFPYSLQLAHGLSRLPLLINSVLLMLLGPAVYVLANRYGAIGGAAVWPGLQIVYFVVGTIATHRRVPGGGAKIWLLRSVGIPGLISVATALAFMPLLAGLSPGSAVKLAALVASVVLAQLACLSTLPWVRSLIALRGHAIFSRLQT
jgi:O-antigen/teichoic acid export membrane protein